jgi:phage-related protein
MPETHVVFFREDDGAVPVLEWFDGLDDKAQAKCLTRIERLRQLGHELRRPEADYLRDGIYELRIGLQGLHYRILYFFHGRTAAVLSHGLVKERAIPTREIELALRRKLRFEQSSQSHTHSED